MEIRRCSSSSTITEKDTLMTQNLCLRETDFTSDTKLPLLQEKKKKCTMLEGTEVVSRDRNSNKQKPAQSNRENVDSSGAVLLFTVICNTLFKKKATRFSEVPWKSSNNWDQQDPNSFLFCIRNARGSYLMGTSADQLGHYRHTAECKPSVFIKVSPLSKVVNTTEKYTDCCHL